MGKSFQIFCCKNKELKGNNGKGLYILLNSDLKVKT